MGGIIKPPMMPVYLPRKHRAGLIGISAYRDDSFDALPEKFIHVF